MVYLSAIDGRRTGACKNLKSVIYPGFSNVAHAKNIYFTGVTPPEITRFKKDDWMGYAELPIFCNIYVPKDSAEAYKAWYKKYGEKDSVKWHTYDDSIPEISNTPETEAE